MTSAHKFPPQPCPRLEHLNLDMCENTTDMGLRNLLRLCGGYNANLRKVDLSSCFQISDRGLNSLLRKCGAGLRYLNLSGTGVSGAGIQTVCPALKYLNVSRCDKVTDASLKNILDKCGGQGWKFMSCSHCQESGQPASWLLVGCTI